MTNMEVATYLGMVGMAVSMANKDGEIKDDVVTPKLLEAVRIAQMDYFQRGMNEFAETIKNFEEAK